MEEFLKCEDCGVQNETVITTICPYAQEITDEEIEVDLCPDCYDERCMYI